MAANRIKENVLVVVAAKRIKRTFIVTRANSIIKCRDHGFKPFARGLQLKQGRRGVSAAPPPPYRLRPGRPLLPALRSR